jgi:uncharacterized membrane-anchored protein YhcB (DUF1043 family)
MMKSLNWKKFGSSTLLPVLAGAIIGILFGWLFSRLGANSTLQQEMDKKAKVLTEKKKLGEELREKIDRETALNDKITELTSTRDKCLADYDERGKLLKVKGEETSLLYDSLGQSTGMSSSEQAHELFCINQQGGQYKNGDCTCDGTWDGAICVNSQTVARQQICEMSNGTWQAKKCACGQGMMFTEKGCVPRPYSKAAQDVIAGLERQVKSLKGQRDSWRNSFGVCKKKFAQPPKLTAQSTVGKLEIISCTPGGACSP